MVQVTKRDGTVQEVAGSMNDKLFTRLAPAQGWVSYKVMPDMTRAEALASMSDKDRELKAYCEHHDMIERIR